MKMKRREFIGLGGAAVALTAVGLAAKTPAFAQAKLVLKATDVHPLGYPTVEAVVRMGKKLEAATNGRLSIQMYPSMQLGGEKEMIEQAQVGALAMARISVGPMGPIVPELNVFNLPFMFRDDAHMEKVIDGPIGDEMLKKLSDHPTARPDRHVLDERRHPQRLQQQEADQDGRRPQGPQDPHDGQSGVRRHHELRSAATASPWATTSSSTRCRPASSTARRTTIRATPADSTIAMPSTTRMTGHLMIPEILVFSKKIWETLSKEDQALILKVAKEAQQEQRKLWYDSEKRIAQAR